MEATSAGPTARERTALEAARRGDERAFRQLIQPHLAELHAHCYRMLGSAHDSDDALQETLLRAWRGLARFEGRSSLRSWLYRIATNACLDLIAGRPKRALPIDRGPEAGAGHELGEPLTDAVWIEPCAAEQLEDGRAAPEARYERRESVELAFVAALQHLPPTQRAALILRDVLGFSAREAAETLDATVPAVNGALRRARKAVGEHLPGRSQQATLRALGDSQLRKVTERYVDAWERGDVEAIVAMLAEDASLSMPPLPTWYRGRDAIAAFLTRVALQERWRLLPTRVNGQLAFGCYAWDPQQWRFRGLALDVLTLEGTRATAIISFVTPYTRDPARERFVADVFGRFGLPEALD